MIIIQLLRSIYVTVMLICTLRTTDGSTKVTADELQRSVAVSQDALETAIHWIRKAQSILPVDIEVINGGNVRNCTRNAESNYLEKPMDCEEVLQQGNRVSGVYKIWPRNKIINGPIDVYCDMETDGGGWTVIQRRGDFGQPRDYFFKEWNSYKNGFGDIRKDFWIGNDKLFSLTNQRAYSLRFDLTDWDRASVFALYDGFWIEDEAHDYKLHVNGYSGTAGDSFTHHDGSKFSTKDRDNDSDPVNCSDVYKGGWWYKSCHYSNLNGLYLRGKHDSFADGVEWYLFKGHYYSLKDTLMMIKPVVSRRSRT